MVGGGPAPIVPGAWEDLQLQQPLRLDGDDQLAGQEARQAVKRWLIARCLSWLHSRTVSKSDTHIRTNFFEKRVGDYQKAGVMGGYAGESLSEFALDKDF